MTKLDTLFADIQDVEQRQQVETTVPVFTFKQTADLISLACDLCTNPDYLAKDHLERLAYHNGYPQEMVDHIYTVVDRCINKIYGGC
jgi:hypothetical protein